MPCFGHTCLFSVGKEPLSMKFFLTLPSCFTANNCRCLLPWTWVEVLIVIAICAVVKKKKKQPGFINQIRMHELKCLVILWGGFFVSYFFLVFSLFPPSYFSTFLRFRVIVECAETEQAKLRLCWQGDITIPNYNSQLKF